MHLSPEWDKGTNGNLRKSYGNQETLAPGRNRIAQLRKQHGLSQSELAQKAGVSRTIIGNYERSANTPSIEVLVKLARVFNVSVDFLIGEGQLSALDRDLLKRIEDIEKLDPQTREHLFFLIDNVIQNHKTKKAMGNA